MQKSYNFSELRWGKVKVDSRARAPKAFTKKYPECDFQVATTGNFYRYFTTPLG